MKKILTVSSIFVLIFSFCFKPVFPAEAAGASLFFSPSSGTYPVNTEFSIRIKINSGGENINAAEGNLIFDKEKIEVIGISKADSIFPLWPIGPTFSNKEGTINFGGGLTPPGFTGVQGNVCEITFRTKKVGTADLIFSSGSILANDGKGTNILSSIGSGSFIVSPQVEMPVQGQAERKNEEDLMIKQPVSLNISTQFDQDHWFNNNNLLVRWDIPASSTEVSFALDNDPEFDPGKKGIIATNQKFEKVDDGIWYFHIRFKEGQAWTETATYKVQIDATSPAPFKIEAEDEEAGKWPILRFQTSDALSGLARYEIHIDSFTDQEITLEPRENLLAVADLEVGKHTAIIKAIDNAGNETFTTQDFIVKPIETPVIKNYSEELESTDQFFISGTALADTSINIFIQKGDEEKVIAKKTQSDKSGHWYFIDSIGQADGRYVAWAQAESANGLKSGQSDRVSFLVSPPIFARIGSFVVNYFTIFTSLLFMIILIVVSLLYLVEIIRKRLKKETFEVESTLHSNLRSLRKEIDRDIAELSKYKGMPNFDREKARTKEKIDRKVRVTEGKIMKEVKDVEKILK